MTNQLEGGLTPLLPPEELESIGFSIAAYPFTLLMSSIAAMQASLEQIKQGVIPKPKMTFDELKTAIGFDEYYRVEEKYSK